jgi:hypothetical protein
MMHRLFLFSPHDGNSYLYFDTIDNGLLLSLLLYIFCITPTPSVLDRNPIVLFLGLLEWSDGTTERSTQRRSGKHHHQTMGARGLRSLSLYDLWLMAGMC